MEKEIVGDACSTLKGFISLWGLENTRDAGKNIGKITGPKELCSADSVAA